MQENTSRIIDPVLGDSRLANLGLTRDNLTAAVEAGIAATQNITLHNPVMAAGFTGGLRPCEISATSSCRRDGAQRM